MSWNVKLKEVKPEEIEAASMAIIAEEMNKLGGVDIPEINLPVLKRVIHTTADFEFMKTLKFSPEDQAVTLGREALKRGVGIITDTQMAAAGMSKPSASKFNNKIICRMAEPDVKEEALKRGVTRAVISIERAVEETPDAIFAIGNAPTALIKLCELISEGKAKPSLIIGVPVGFVNVVESKEILAEVASKFNVPYIAAMGRKGGSPIASTIINALYYGIK
ncbi:MAG: precorrin-8X methylmutase [Synergistaceae bacterium]|nr:precorrin-8X methylmutase [Synergistaceae bacterium]MBQ7570209.1 precorrin-8X methylmutase [Synergistaceae bacterium]MBQ9581915.1 precorrin-8X methylmutase [Synergistaceae bacterium]MBQ9896202.1 precorrin-8X methylmutase [Synergistaceae bacterium]MBR0097392.1 precorrin-8X methylmutase [Synergistaceae bacterium]